MLDANLELLHKVKVDTKMELLMTKLLNPETLHALRSEAWDKLIRRYASDPDIAFIRGIDLQLAAMSASTPSPAATPQKEKKERSKKLTLGDLVEAESIRLFKNSIKAPVYSRDVVPELRKAKIPLPDDDERAVAAVGQVFAKRKKVFKKFPGDSNGKKATSRWHLQAA